MQIAKVNLFEGLEEITREDVPLSRHTWNRLGGPARYYIQPRSTEELQAAVLRCLEEEIRIYVLGLGANLLVGDEGVDGAVFRLDDDYWHRVEFGSAGVAVGAGVDLQRLLLDAVRRGLGGLETLAGIPATIGGAIRMNAGGRFGDISAVVRQVSVMDQAGAILQIDRDDLIFDYRRCDIDAPFILGAMLELEEEDPEALAARMKEIWMYKRNSQPLNARSAGCVFKNPPGASAGALIERAGLKGLRVGGAEVSDKHANFIVTHQGATAGDVSELVKIVRDKVQEKADIRLETEMEIWP